MVNTSKSRPPQFMRRVQNRPALRRKGSVVVFAQLMLVVSGLAVGGGLAYVGSLYTVHNTTFRLRRLLLDAVPTDLHEAVRTELASASNANLLTTDLEPLQGRLQQIPQIRAATIRRVLPDAVEVHVQLREPWGRLDALDGGYLVSADGVLLSRAGEEARALPAMTLAVELDGMIDDRRRIPVLPETAWFGAGVRVFDWMATLASAEMDRAELVLTAEGVVIAFDGMRILLGDDANLDAKAANLRALLQGAPPPPGSLVDLRFEDMVIVRDPDSPSGDDGGR